MPKIDDMENYTSGNFGFSAVPVHTLESSEYTLVNLVVDTSGSVSSFRNELQQMVETVHDSCLKSPRADNLLLRLVTFNDNTHEFHGFKPLSSINKDDYKNCLNIGGMTALYDASVNALEATEKYAEVLKGSHFQANAINFILTDGGDNVSTLNTKRVKEITDRLLHAEALESIINVLVRINIQDASCRKMLDSFAAEAGLQSIDVTDATASSLAKLGGFISKSISSQSKSLGSGAAASLSF